MNPDFPRGRLRITSQQRALSPDAAKIFNRLVASRGVEPTAKMLGVSASTVERLMYSGKWSDEAVALVETRLAEGEARLQAIRSVK